MYRILLMLICIFCIFFNSLGYAYINEKTLEKFQNTKIPLPEQSRMMDAANIILTAIDANAFLKGDWWEACGKIGVEMISSKNVYARYAYKAMFSLAKSKLYSSNYLSDGMLAVPEKENSSSWVYKRERNINILVSGIISRFTFDSAGDYYSNYDQILERNSSRYDKDKTMFGHSQLNIGLKNAHEFYAKNEKLGFKDTTLGDLLGLATAILEYDGMPNNYLIFPHANQIYIDTLTSILTKKKEKPGYPIIDLINDEMIARGLNTNDIIAFPDDNEKHNILLKIIEDDLKMIANKNYAEK